MLIQCTSNIQKPLCQVKTFKPTQKVCAMKHIWTKIKLHENINTLYENINNLGTSGWQNLAAFRRERTWQ